MHREGGGECIKEAGNPFSLFFSPHIRSRTGYTQENEHRVWEGLAFTRVARKQTDKIDASSEVLVTKPIQPGARKTSRNEFC
jgi:hypothetical protein